MSYGCYSLVTRGGGKSTKLLVQFLNGSSQHSVCAARLLAIFKEDKDNYECIEKVFGPVVNESMKALSNISTLGIKVNVTQLEEKFVHTNNLNIKGIQNWPNALQQLVFNKVNQHISPHCSLCKKLVREPVSTPSADTNQDQILLSECWVTLAGDWEFIARLLGLTGPNGTYFCNFCHVQIKDLVKGTPHTPWLLQNTSSNSQTKFTVRTFESMLSDNERYVKSGAVKAKAYQYHNCESKPIFQAAGPVLKSVSCMPLHLSLGLGKQALELIEKEAIAIDNSIKDANGEADNDLSEAITEQENLLQACSELQQKMDMMEQAANASVEQLQQFVTETASFHQKDGRRYMSLTKDYVPDI